MSRRRHPVTPAVALLRSASIPHDLHVYDFQAGPVAATAASALDLQLHRVVKTLVWETPAGSPFVVLMHGDLQVRATALARAVGVPKVRPCERPRAERLTGFRIGGISPFAHRRAMSFYAEASVAALDRVIVSAGRRGLLVELATADLLRLLEPELVHVARRVGGIPASTAR